MMTDGELRQRSQEVRLCGLQNKSQVCRGRGQQVEICQNKIA